MDAAELREWVSYAARFGMPHANGLRMLAELCAMFANVHRGKHSAPVKASDFLRG
jgi:hypothetical protein